MITGIRANRLRVEIADSGQSFARDSLGEDLDVIADRLHGLFGHDATLTFEPADARSARAVLEIPHGRADSNRR